MTPLSEDAFVQISRLVSEPRRCAILSLLSASAGPVACFEICARLPLTQATVSHHMKELVLAGLVRAEKSGRAVFYQTDRVLLESYLRDLRDRILPKARGRRPVLTRSSSKAVRAPSRPPRAKGRS